MRSYHFSGKARRRGQALLLAVLIMIFAALLSAAFIGIVAANLNQTARQSDKNRSLEAANAGLKYVNDQLTASADGERWRSEMESIPPAPGDASYTFYYTPMEIAQGWARTTAHPTVDLNGDGKIDVIDERMALDATRATGKLELVKIPDPRTQPNAPNTFLSQVVRVANTSVVTPSLAGSLKVTVIGVSPDDPTAYHRIDAYKGGFKESPVAQVMNVVSSYDFKRDSTIVAQADGGANNGIGATPVLGIVNAKGDFTKLGVPFPITLSAPNGIAGAPFATQTAVVTAVAQPGTDNTVFNLTLAKPLTTAALAGVRVDVAANLGGPDGVHLDNIATNPETPFTVPISLSDAPVATTSNQVDGARVNGSLIWSGTMAMAKLRPLTSSFGSTGYVPGTIWASGVIAPDPNGTSVAKVTDILPGTGPDTLKASDDSGIFSTSVQSNQNELVSDSWNRSKGVPSANTGMRAVTDFHPPAIDSGASLQRYRNLARYSQGVANASGTVSAQNTGALYGYGEGIYIDNPLDKEKVYDGTKLREMTQTELAQMWLSQVPSTVTTPPDYLRTGTPAIVTDANDSLEQKHLRGWVGPDEFRGRGVEIELGDNSIAVTRDSRSDAIYAGGEPTQTWKDPSTGNPVPGRYTEVLKWPTNGVIFAEGNIRIKGNAINVKNSLTVVSMGNIYIEDSLSADDDGDGNLATPVGKVHKILLMAKRNVVMNPTRLLGRTDQQTRISGTQTLSAGATTVTVADPLGFKKGDFIQTGTTAAPVYGYVNTDPAPNATALAVNIISGGAVTDGDLVYTPNAGMQLLASAIAVTPVVKNVFFSAITTPTDVIQRRFNIPLGTDLGKVRIAFNHEGERKGAISVETEVTPSTGTHTLPTTPIYLSNKGVFLNPAASSAPYLDASKTVLAQADNKISGQYSEPAPAAIDDFIGTPAAAPADQTDATAATRYISAVSTEMAAKLHDESDPNGIGWKYKITPDPVNTAYQNLPFFYLAGVGNHVNYGATTIPVERRPQINTGATGGAAYNIPLATSINFTIDGVATKLFNDNWNTVLGNYDSTGQFGFRPVYLDAATLPAEDILTGDQSFYQADSVQSTLDSRSAYDLSAPTNGVVIGQNALVLRQSDGIIQPVAMSFPAYRLLDAKLENVTQAFDTGINQNKVNAIAPGHSFNVNAYVYAQTGSWFVIPGPLYDDRLRGDATKTYLDVNNNGLLDAGECIKGAGNLLPNVLETGDYADLNHDGTIEDSEKYAMARYSRFNYTISFTGAIAENQTPLVNDVLNGTDTTARGAVKEWMDKWTSTTYDGTAFTYDRIRYNFDPTIIAGTLEDNPATTSVDETDYGFRLPQTPDLFNVS